MAVSEPLDEYVVGLPEPADLSNKVYPSGEDECFDQSIDDYSVLVAYMLKRAGFPYAESVAEHAMGAEYGSVTWAIFNAWADLEGFQPGSALGNLAYALERLEDPVPVPRWWLNQLGYIPLNERYEHVDLGWWPETIPVLEDELPPWEVSQEAT